MSNDFGFFWQVTLKNTKPKKAPKKLYLFENITMAHMSSVLSNRRKMELTDVKQQTSFSFSSKESKEKLTFKVACETTRGKN